jgi:hypothetical protein
MEWEYDYVDEVLNELRGVYAASFLVLFSEETDTTKMPQSQ